jgi:hypothetical protein
MTSGRGVLLTEAAIAVAAPARPTTVEGSPSVVVESPATRTSGAPVRADGATGEERAPE